MSDIAPWSMPPIPMSFIVSKTGSRISGGAARMPFRGASVATTWPDRSMDSATIAKARASFGSTITS